MGWTSTFANINRSERTMRIVQCGLTLAGGATFAPRVVNGLGTMRNLTFALWIFDDARTAWKSESFQGGSLKERARDITTVTMDGAAFLLFFAPNRCHSLIPIAGDAAWLSTCLLSAFIAKEASEERTAIVDAFFAEACLASGYLFPHPLFQTAIPVLGVLSGSVGLYYST